MSGLAPIEGFRKIGWHRLRLDVLQSWRLAKIDRDYLLFGHASGQPALELKWAHTGRRSPADPVRYLSKLSAGSGKRTEKLEVIPWTPPGTWQSALSPRSVSGFSWEADGEAGRGIIVCCPACGTVTAIRFFVIPSSDSTDPIAHILASFGDHPVEGDILWSVFDMQAQLPAAYVLESHRFDAGRFELRFSNGGNRLILYRWAMARVLLRQNPMEKWPENLGFPPQARQRRGRSRNGDYVEWETLARKPFFGWAGRNRRLRLMHMASRDRIIGMELAGREGWAGNAHGLLDGDPMDRLWDAYGLA